MRMKASESYGYIVSKQYVEDLLFGGMIIIYARDEVELLAKVDQVIEEVLNIEYPFFISKVISVTFEGIKGEARHSFWTVYSRKQWDMANITKGFDARKWQNFKNDDKRSCRRESVTDNK